LIVVADSLATSLKRSNSQDPPVEVARCSGLREWKKKTGKLSPLLIADRIYEADALRNLIRGQTGEMSGGLISTAAIRTSIGS
jgi:hypothetical protein